MKMGTRKSKNESLGLGPKFNLTNPRNLNVFQKAIIS
jgi:hypothetical protein